MREALIILPQETNLGEKLTILCAKLQHDLTMAFGGCTVARDLIGSWKRPGGDGQIERVQSFMVAMEPSERNAERLKGIAAIYAAMAGEQSIYVRTADGTVHFVMPATMGQTANHMAETMAMAGEVV